ncbi:PadR family transcriptional regulator [Schaalia suimastitidis]|uniref:PadR family transcriptional regulator n=1 Tax=Schaalia suimastitidis TaxID=121163 RepID=UPI000A031432|nr:PadR family transcriptional regulator [Schaalia suimastitidis]
MTQNSFWILTALADQPRHGYDILSQVEHLSGGTVTLRANTLYAALERLASEQRIEVEREEIVNGRARRYYRLTPTGHEDLAAEIDLLEARAHAARARLLTQRRMTPAPAPRLLRAGRYTVLPQRWVQPIN